jgi:hypothetical protein
MFEWDYLAGSEPDGFEVYLSRDGGEFGLDQTVAEQFCTVSGNVDETITVQVRAFLGEEFGPFSEVSEEVTFRVLPAPTGLQIRCPEGQTFVELGGGWWSCQ